MLAKVISYIPAIIGVLSIGLFVYLNNPKSTLNRTFALSNIFATLWLFCLFVADTTDNQNNALWFLRLALFFSQFMILYFFYFTLLFPFKSKVRKTIKLVLSIPLLLTAIASLTPLALVSVSLHASGVLPEEVGPLYTLSDLLAIIYILGGVFVLLSKYKKSNSQQKSQIKFVLFGLSVALLVNIATGFILTSLGISSEYILLGGFSIFIFSLFVAYSMVKHGFMDIRLIVARSLAYLFSLGIVAGSISILIYGLSRAVEDTQISENVQSLLFITATLLLVLSYPSIKRFFDKVTNSLFYRDAYDAEQFIGQLNQVVVSDIEIYSLLRKVVSVIEENLKVTYCAFATVNHDGGVVLVSDDPDERQDLAKLDLKLLRDVSKKHKVIVTDYLDEQRETKLKQHLIELDLAAIASLVSKKSNEPEQFSKVYMILGLKKSGNPYTSQDVRVLEIISNSLALAIQNALRFEEISRFNITLQEKIDEATRELKRTNDKLRALDEAKDEFISMASHQLRTPLTSVKGYVSMVLEGDTGPVKANQRKLLQQAFDSSQRMVYLIADLLNVSRLRTGKFVIENRETNLADVVSGEVEQLKEAAENKQIKLSYEKPAKFPVMLLDETKIRQVIMNFLDNAIYYTPSGGEVTISLQKTGDSVEYKVVDTGVGVPKGEQHHLFTKFYRAGNARKMRPDGTGLGLYMAQKVVVAQGGAVIFESEEGKGSTFGFRFPLKPVSSKKAITD